jgi:hypothetical protein
MASWETILREENRCGDINDETKIYVELEYGTMINKNYYIDFGGEYSLIKDDKDKKNDVLGLITIHIPETLRNQGIFTNILTLLEKRAEENKQHLYVGPFMEEDSKWIIRTCKKRGYKTFPPFSMIKYFL